jgi:hypothetical protein
MLQGGVVDLAAAGPPAAGGGAAAGAGAAAVLGDQRVLDRRLHHPRAGEEVEVVQADRYALAPAGPRRDPFDGDEAAGALEGFHLLGEHLEGHRQVGVFGVLVHHEASEGLLVRLLPGNVRHMDDLDCHQGGFLLKGKVMRRDEGNRKRRAQANRRRR